MPLKSQNKFEIAWRRRYDGAAQTPSPRCLRICLRGDAARKTPRMTKLTKRTFDATQIKSSDYVPWDDDLPEFGLRVFKSGKRSYVVQYRAAGRSRRVTIGPHGVWTPEEARREAKVLLGAVARGGNPAEERTLDREAIIVRELFTRYLEDLRNGLVLGKRGRPTKGHDNLHRCGARRAPHRSPARQSASARLSQVRHYPGHEGHHGGQDPRERQGR